MSFFRSVARVSANTFRGMHTSAVSNVSVAPMMNIAPMMNVTPLSVAPMVRIEDMLDSVFNKMSEGLECMNRNKRKLKKANHGARPCNSRGRKSRRVRRHLYG